MTSIDDLEVYECRYPGVFKFINISHNTTNLSCVCYYPAVLSNSSCVCPYGENFNNVTDEYKVLKSSSKFVGEKFKEGPLFRGGVYSEFVQSVPLIYNEELEAIGAGAVVDKEGIILTNWHVVDKAKNLHVWFKPESGKKWQDTDSYQAEVLVVDEKKDLALIKIHGAQKLKPIPIGNTV